MTTSIFSALAGRATACLAVAPALALPAVLLTIEPVLAEGGATNRNCVRSGTSVSCAVQWGGRGGNFPRIILVAAPKTEDEIAQAAERERKWVAYCQPVIKPDRHGVGRYFYKVAGCEFGRNQD